jgi:hypothetical protein
LRVQPLGEQGRISALVRELAWQAGVTRLRRRHPTVHLDPGVERESLRTDTLARQAGRRARRPSSGVPQQLELEPGAPTDSQVARAKPGSACAARPRPSS